MLFEFVRAVLLLLPGNPKCLLYRYATVHFGVCQLAVMHRRSVFPAFNRSIQLAAAHGAIATPKTDNK